MTVPAGNGISSDDDTFRVLTTALQVGVVLHGPGAEILYANPKASELLGLSEDQLLGRSSFDPRWHFTDGDGHRLGPEAYPAVQVLRTKAPLRDMIIGVYRPVTQDRVWVQVRADPLLELDGSVRQIVVSFSDITALKVAEAARHAAVASAEQFRRALDQVPAFVYMKDRASRYTYANVQTLALFGVTAEALPGMDDTAFFPPDAVRRLRAIDQRVLAGEQTREEVVVDHEDGGREVYVEVKSPLHDPDQPAHAVGILGISIDITELRRLEEQLQQAMRLDSVGRLAGGVAHDFNNMLGVILGRAELALSHVDPESPAHADLLEIVHAGRRSAELTRHLLAFARKQTVTPRRLDVAVEVGRSRKLLQRLLTEEIPLDWTAPEGVWPIHLDPTQLDQVLVNLCVNARDAIRTARAASQHHRPADAVRLDARNVTLDAEFCAAHGGGAPGDYVALSVEDTGCGIRADQLATIFEPFYTTKPMGEGTGLGLATVFGTVRQAGGFIAVSSEIGHGSTFTVYLPRHLDADRTTDARVTPGEGTPTLGGTETILITEDEPALLRLSAQSLRRLGYTVLTAATPTEALGIAATHVSRIDLLLTDVVMPEMDGRTLAATFRQQYPGIRQLFMSGFPGDSMHGADPTDPLPHFIAKPFTLAELSVAVRETLDAPD